jgi:acid phosphatase type 7
VTPQRCTPYRFIFMVGPFLLMILSMAGCQEQPVSPTPSSPAPTNPSNPPESPTPPTSSSEVTVVAAGDIACDPGSSSFNEGLGTADSCRQKYVADLIEDLNPAAVLTLGDHQYEDNTPEKFTASYALSWGRLKPITYPVAGNHEYKSKDAAGYYSYFGDRAGDPKKGYYSYDLGAWHIIALNSNCDEVGGCDLASAQGQWLESDLAAHSNLCTLAYWHQPRFSSGEHGSDPTYTDFWKALYKTDADLILVAHDHDYERFAPQTPDGQLDAARGLREFVVGTGGKSRRALGNLEPNSEASNADTYGVLQLTLKDSSYDWSFIPEAGASFTDSGSQNCH